jgi:hypothetical protein
MTWTLTSFQVPIRRVHFVGVGLFDENFVDWFGRALLLDSVHNTELQVRCRGFENDALVASISVTRPLSSRFRPTEHAASLHRSPPRVAESNLKSGHAVLGKVGHTSIARESGVDIVGQGDGQECGGYVPT